MNILLLLLLNNLFLIYIFFFVVVTGNKNNIYFMELHPSKHFFPPRTITKLRNKPHISNGVDSLEVCFTDCYTQLGQKDIKSA